MWPPLLKNKWRKFSKKTLGLNFPWIPKTWVLMFFLYKEHQYPCDHLTRSSMEMQQRDPDLNVLDRSTSAFSKTKSQQSSASLLCASRVNRFPY